MRPIAPAMTTLLFAAIPVFSASAQDAAAAVADNIAQPGSGYRVKVAVSYPGSSRPEPAGQETEIIESLEPIVSEPVAGPFAEPGKILATLGGAPITEEDVLRELWRRRGRETFDWLVGRALLEKELRGLGLEVRAREVSDRLELHLDGLRRAFPGLASPDELTRAAGGLPLDEYRERAVWTELALRKIMQAKSRPTEEQLRRFHAEIRAEFVRPERVLVSQVFIPPQPAAGSDGIAAPDDWRRAERQILEADSRLRMKENFADVARAYGTGGQLSRRVGRGELLRELEAAAFSILPGAITTPIKTSMGYHILTVEEKEERREPTFEEVRQEVLARYREAEFLVTAGDFMAALKSEAVESGELDLSGADEAFTGTED